MARRTSVRKDLLDAIGNGGSMTGMDVEAGHGGSNGEDPSSSDAPDVGCGVRQLPERLQLLAAEVAGRVNPVNAPVVGRSLALADTAPATPLAAAVVTGKYWGPTPRKLTVSFVDATSADLRRRIVSHLNAWSRTGCVEFVETEGTGQVRISRGGGGYWSYLGTDILLIPSHRPTMNLQGFTMSTDEREFRRVVRHEAGHTLGMPHEHMRRELVARVDPEKAYAYFWRTQRWDRRTVDEQVLTPLDQATILQTPPDQDSIMCYYLPGSITRDGQPIRGGTDINQTDYAFVGQIYPRASAGQQVEDEAAGGSHPEDWPETEDVADVEAVLASLA